MIGKYTHIREMESTVLKIVKKVKGLEEEPSSILLKPAVASSGCANGNEGEDLKRVYFRVKDVSSLEAVDKLVKNLYQDDNGGHN